MVFDERRVDNRKPPAARKEGGHRNGRLLNQPGPIANREREFFGDDTDLSGQRAVLEKVHDPPRRIFDSIHFYRPGEQTSLRHATALFQDQ